MLCPLTWLQRLTRLSVKAYGKTGNNAYLLVTDMSGKVLQRMPVTNETTDIDMSALTTVFTS